MDVVNTKIGQEAARNVASTLSSQSFVSSSLVGFASGVSQFTKSETPSVAQQVKSAEKVQVNMAEKQQAEDDKKSKANAQSADTLTREETVELNESLASLSQELQTNGTKLSFTLNDSANQPIVTVMDRESGNVIRQIPSEEMLVFAERMKELESNSANKTGLVFDGQA